MAAPLALLCSSHSVLAAPSVILIIGDGMDDQQITIARNYLAGAQGKLLMDELPLRAASQVLTVKEDGSTIYVADSANSATSMATGEITSRGRISTSAGTDQPLTTIVELAEAAGLKTGLVSTASVTDATPAAFVAHINMRYCENPEAINGARISTITLPDCPQYTAANGGAGSISEQIAASDVDVVLGGGLKHFSMKAEASEQSVRQQAQANGFHVIDSADGLATAPLDKKLLGLFSDSTMPVRLQGAGGRRAETPKPSWANQVHRYLGSVELPAVMSCEANPQFSGMPSLEEMTAVALQRLDNERGFFLMVESASIDKQSHERKPCGSIGELAQLNEALKVALDYADKNPETLVLVTADHSQAAQLVPATSLFDAFGIPVYTPGHLARIVTDEGAILAVNYATNNFSYEEHSGANVPLFANSEGLGRVPSLVRQPEIFTIVRNYLFPHSEQIEAGE
ncbi:MAG: alkaline phosphatase [Halieaceae bacterium]